MSSVNEWKLVYAPQNDILESLLSNAATSLKLDGVEGVHNGSEIAAVMGNRQLVAGVQFNHPAVCFTSISLIISTKKLSEVTNNIFFLNFFI